MSGMSISGIAGGIPSVGPSAALMGQGTSTSGVAASSSNSLSVKFDNILKNLMSNPSEVSKMSKELLEALLLYLMNKQKTDPLSNIATTMLAGMLSQAPQASMGLYDAAVTPAIGTTINVTA